MNDVPGHSWVEARSNGSEWAPAPLARDRIDGFRHRVDEAEVVLGSWRPHHDSTTSPTHEAGIHVQECGVAAAGASRSHPRHDAHEDNDGGRR